MNLTDLGLCGTHNAYNSMAAAIVSKIFDIKKEVIDLSISVAEKPVLLVKNTNGNIVAFHNVCKHRCLKLVDQPKNVGKLISCPYHAWAFDLDGKLRASPFFGGVDKDQQPSEFNSTRHGHEESSVPSLSES